MLHHFNCPPPSHRKWSRDESLVFDWDDETGKVTGRDAEYVLACFRDGKVGAHPRPWGWNLTSTKSRTDIAAVIGDLWELPPELADDYPQYEDEFGDDFDGYLRDEDGKIIGQVMF